MREIRRLIVHHSASSLGTTLEDVRGWHLERGFDDIGYHFVIEGDGALRYGRPVHLQGAHAKGANEDSIGVCLVGNNRDPDSSWRPVQIARLHALIGALVTIWPGLSVAAHCQSGTTDTECPSVELATVSLLR